MAEMTCVQAIRDGIAEEMRRDERVFVMGEDVQLSIFGTSGRLVDEFGAKRIRNTAIAENTTVDAALGAALTGMRPIVDLMFAAINLVAASAIITDVAMTRYKLGGHVDVPIVIMSVGGGYGGSGGSHSQSVQAKMMNSPGLKVVMPSNAYDAKGLMKTAIRDNDPVVFLSSSRVMMARGEVPDQEYTIPFKRAAVKREGKDVTVVATAYMVSMALNVATSLAAEGISVEVIDPRTLVPLDKETILKSVAKTGRLVAMDESPLTCGVASEISAIVCEEAFHALKAPIKRVATMDIPLPGNALQEAFVLPSEEKLSQAIKSIMG